MIPRPLVVALLILPLCALVLALTVGVTVATGAGPAAGSASSQAGDGLADWTVLVYMAGDNDLETAALNDLREIAQVGSSAQVKVVAQVDRIMSRDLWDDSTAGNWAGTRRFLLEQGMEPDVAAAAQDLGELNTGDPVSLADFITWGVTSYPARHYALVLWSHGAAWQGLARDDTSGGDSLTLSELTAALAIAQSQTGNQVLDLIGFDACLMGQLDVFQAIAPYAQVSVASSELEPTQGWAWDVWLKALAANPGQDAAAIAGVIVDSYVSSYQGTADVTLAAFDLAQVGQISAQLHHLSEVLLNAQPADYAAIASARANVDAYAPHTATELHAVDLGRFAQLLTASGASGEVTAAAEAMSGAIHRARLAHRAGEPHLGDSGVSIYFPPTAAEYQPTYEEASPLPHLTHWAEFLKAYHNSLSL